MPALCGLSKASRITEAAGRTARTELLSEGIIVPVFRVRDRNRILTSVSFKDLDTKYPFTLMCPQNRTEAVLLRRLQALGCAVQRPCDVVAVRPGEDDIEVQFKSGEELKTVRTQWLVGCDGMHSVVREQSAIPSIGGDYEESFVLADVEMEWPVDRDEVSLFFSDQGLVVVAPLPGDPVSSCAYVDLRRNFQTCGGIGRKLASGTPKARRIALWSQGSSAVIDCHWTRAWPSTAAGVSPILLSPMHSLQESNTIRSPGWIATEYANINSPASFYSVGGQRTSSGGGSSPILTTGSPLPSGNSNYAYGYTLAATGGTPPYAWSIASGSLPSPLTLSSTSGLISGVRPSGGRLLFYSSREGQCGTLAAMVPRRRGIAVSPNQSAPREPQNSVK